MPKDDRSVYTCIYSGKYVMVAEKRSWAEWFDGNPPRRHPDGTIIPTPIQNNPGQHVFPGGHFKDLDEPVLHGAVREFYEETGYDLTPLIVTDKEATDQKRMNVYEQFFSGDGKLVEEENKMVFSALYVKLRTEAFVQVLGQVQKTLTGNRSDNQLTRDDELRQVYVMDFDEAIKKFAKEHDRNDDKKKTDWFTAILEPPRREGMIESTEGR